MQQHILESELPPKGERTVLEAVADGLDALLSPVMSKAFFVSMIVTGIMSIPIFFDVVARFTMSRSLDGIIELEEYFMVLIVFLALGHVQKSGGGHIRIELITCKLSKKFVDLLEAFNNLTCTAFFGLAFWRACLAVIQKQGEHSVMLSIPVSIFIAVAAAGLLLLTLTLLSQTLRDISHNARNGRWLGLLVVVVLAAAFLSFPIWYRQLPVQMSRLGLGVAGMAAMITLLLLGMPIGFAMAIVGFLGLTAISFSPIPALNTLGIAPYSTTASFILAVAPLFICMGLLCSESGISKDLFDSADKWLGHLPGGLIIASLAGCAGFAAVCGDSMATAVTMGSVALPEIRRKKYNSSLACGALAAGGTLGILIPPSMGFIFYALVTEESVGKLFVAGLVPGILLTGMYILCVYVIAKMRPDWAPCGTPVSLREKVLAIKGVIWMVLLFILILGGILCGVFSPTEGAAVGVFMAFFILLLRRRMNRKVLVSVLSQTADITTKLLMILIGVGVLGYFLAASRMPDEMAMLITGHGYNRYVVLVGILGMFCILGCLMNVIPMILLTLPTLFPTIQALGFDPLWFGVVTVIMMEMGQITPPVGVNVFALSSVASDVPMGAIFKGIIPFMASMVVMLALLIVCPGLATWLVDALF
ncbi:TRAP transporter large permease [Desulfocurvus sp. DL9XJH121]